MRITKLALFFLTFFNNYVLVNFFYAPYLYKENGNGYFVSFALAMVLSTIVYFFIPKQFFYSQYRSLRIAKINRIILSTYFVGSNILILLISSIALAFNFYQSYSPFIFIVAFVLGSIVISKFNITMLINSSLIFFLAIIALIAYADVSHYKLIDLSELRLISINWNIFKQIPIMAYLAIDNYIFLQLLPKTRKGKSYIILLGSLAFMTLCSIEGAQIACLFGNSLQGFKGIGFQLYNLKPNFLFLENFDFVYIFSITICAMVKISFGFSSIIDLNNRFKRGYRYLMYSLVAICASVIYYFWSSLSEYLIYYLYGLTALLFVYCILIWRAVWKKSKKS